MVYHFTKTGKPGRVQACPGKIKCSVLGKGTSLTRGRAGTQTPAGQALTVELQHVKVLHTTAFLWRQQTARCHALFTDLLHVALAHLQHRQVVVGLGVAVVVNQGQPEALMGQTRISYSLQEKSTGPHTPSIRFLPPAPPTVLHTAETSKYHSQEPRVSCL